MLRQAELPPGVVNIVTGDGRTVAEIVKSDGVYKVAFEYAHEDLGRAAAIGSDIAAQKFAESRPTIVVPAVGETVPAGL